MKIENLPLAALSRSRTAAATAASLLLAAAAAAQTNVFIAGAGDFHAPSDWSPPAVPGAGQTAAVTNPSAITVSQDIASALALSADATLKPAARGLVLAGGVAVPDGTLPQLTWTSAALATNSALLFPGAALAGVTGAAGAISGANVAPTYKNIPVQACFFTNDGVNASFQLQFFERGPIDSKFVKCVKVELEQQADGIHGHADYARYARTFFDMSGRFDFDRAGMDSGTNYVASSLTLFFGPELTVAAPPPPLLIYTNFITAADALLFPGATLADYRSVAALMAGGSFDNDYSDAHIFHFTNNGATANFQLQRRDNGQHTKCLMIELTQQADGIHGRAVDAKYRLATDGYQVGFDFNTGGSKTSIATNLTVAGYGCPAFALSPVPATSSYLQADASGAALAAGAALDRITDLAACLGGRLLNNRDPVPALPFHWQRLSPTSATVQLQAAVSNATYCVKTEIAEAAGALSVRALYAKALAFPDSAAQDRRGIDFDLAGDVLPLASGPDTADGINIVRLEAIVTDAGLAVRAPAVLPGRLTLDGAAFSPARLFPARVDLRHAASLLALDAPGYVTFAAPATGKGGALRIAPPGGALPPAVTNPAHNAFLPLAPAAATVLTGFRLTDITGAVAALGGAAMGVGRGGPIPADIQHWRAGDDVVTFQAQIFDGGHTKCVKVRLAQQGDDIAASVEYARYLNMRLLPGFDFDTGPGSSVFTAVTNNTDSGYGVMSLALISGGTPPPVTLAAGFSLSGPLTVEKRAAYITAPSASIPAPSSIQVRDGATLVASADRTASGSGLGEGCPLAVSGGSVLYLANTFTLGMNRPLTFTASECRLYTANYDDSGQYANNVTLQNGARLIGNRIRVGHGTVPAYWLILGPAASTNAAGFTFVNGGDRPLTVDCRADFSVTAPIRDYADPVTQLRNQPLIKAGPAALILAAAGSTFSGPVTVRAGALRLEAPDALAGTNAVSVLPGAELRIAAPQSKPLTVGVSTNATLALAAPDAFAGGAALTLDGAVVRPELPAALNPAGQTLFSGAATLDFGTTPLTVGPAVFAPGATVTLVGDLAADTLRFSERLTPEQLAALATPSGHRAWQTAEGYVRDTPRATLILLM